MNQLTNHLPAKLAKLLNLCLGIALGFSFLTQPARADVILHAFDWSYSTVAQRAQEIGEAGYKAVLVAPPQKSPKTEEKGNCVWYWRYQPQDFRVIDNCNGNTEDFINMIEALKKEKVRTYADIVVNHMANVQDAQPIFPGDETLKQYANESTYWQKQKLYGDLNKELFTPADFHDGFCISDYTNPDAVSTGRICGQGAETGLPDLDDSDWVRNQRREYIESLYKLGVRGFRLDAAKHMPNSTISSFVPEEIANNSQIFAETITNGGVGDKEYQLFLEPYLRELPPAFGAYDFPLLSAIRKAFSYGNRLDSIADPNSTGNALENRRAVTVVVTHDIPYNDVFRAAIMEPGDEDLGYAYLMGRDGGTPLVFDDGTNCQEDNVQNPKKCETDNKRWADVWNRDRMKRMISFHNRMQGKGMEVLYGDECSLLWRREEDGIVAINKCGENRAITVGTEYKFKWYHPYKDALTDESLPEITGPSYTFNIPGRTARMWYAE